MKLNIRNSKSKRAKLVGFRTRMKTRDGQKILSRKRKKGKHCLTPKR
ncbi:MAG: 50S ribosomal protein L34 [Planctomycetota bacterium]|mgnify:CR=1 FL=1